MHNYDLKFWIVMYTFIYINFVVIFRLSFVFSMLFIYIRDNFLLDPSAYCLEFCIKVHVQNAVADLLILRETTIEVVNILQKNGYRQLVY
jgi:hypothetical protein